MQSGLRTTGYIPPHGSYIALWLDPVRMAECLDDARLTTVASELTPRKYIAYIDEVYDFPLRRHPWHRCVIQFVGVGMPKDEPEEFKTSSMCTPINPSSEHPAGREPLHPSKPFPFPNCYQHSFGCAIVRIPTRDIDYGDAIRLSLKERMRHEDYLSEDWAQHNALRAQHSPPPLPVEAEEATTFPGIVANSDSPVPPIDAMNVQDWLQAVDCSEDQDGALCPHEDAVSEHFDAAITADDDRIPTLNSDTDTVYSGSANSDADADNLLQVNVDSDADTEAIVEAVLGPFRAKVDDIDVVPLVNYSFDLTEGGECADPRGFIEEAEAMAELIRKARDGTLGDPRAATPDSVVPLAQGVVEGTTPELNVVHDEAPTNADSGNATTEHLSGTMETAVERSADTPPESSSETKGETTLPEPRSIWRLIRMKRSPLSSTKGLVKRSQRQISTLAVNIKRLLCLRDVHDD
ncbi:hypothetical protein POSPLADRAFT_1040257 [Postia placenta MAD-698-R-SB12]|uniref:Uncharacterized protein n=1 Tax=Postia placenta MAD-698-R-SB12 TaxID=670580 RepID=A0A1X6MWW2_9APHY|nr:hypothetical protein POSPLADRAFT_1040257 [Postia placenta MAD-698-R-SB12]OSX60839.1 hypothetical protein POSPLADRAFT_1040257 [Postia placenta MAD-698-R-SB12]